MDRREALKFLGKSLGLTLGMPAITSLLSACQSGEITSQVVSSDQKRILRMISDIILPRTNTLGALDLKLDIFVELMLDKTLKAQQKADYFTGFKLFKSQLPSDFDTHNIQVEDVSDLLEQYLSISEQAQADIFAEQALPITDISPEHHARFYIYQFLLTTRSLLMIGFYGSQEVHKSYSKNNTAIPGVYQACI